jgi:hypothetical protein
MDDVNVRYGKRAKGGCRLVQTRERASYHQTLRQARATQAPTEARDRAAVNIAPTKQT